jgi:hypothetical protein
MAVLRKRDYRFPNLTPGNCYNNNFGGDLLPSALAMLLFSRIYCFIIKDLYSTSDITLWTLHCSYFNGNSANIELRVWCDVMLTVL